MNNPFARPYYSLAANTTVANGKAFGGQGFDNISLQVIGIVAGDVVQLQQSNDGDNWEQQGSNITSDGFTVVVPGAVYFRASRTNISGSGTVDAIFASG
jgi:hypothetical protein